jgi:hypothetical protein
MKSPFSAPSPVRHSVNGQEFNFYPPRTWTVGKLRGFLKPLFTALSSLGAGGDTDIGREQIDEQDGVGGIKRRTSLQAINPVLAKQRMEERERTIQTLVDNLTSQPALRSLALLIADSMRDDFEGRPTEADLDKLLEEFTLDNMVQALHGVAMASKELFAPLMERAAPGLKAVLSRVQGEEQPPEQPETETPTPTTSGET